MPLNPAFQYLHSLSARAGLVAANGVSPQIAFVCHAASDPCIVVVEVRTGQENRFNRRMQNHGEQLHCRSRSTAALRQ